MEIKRGVCVCFSIHSLCYTDSRMQVVCAKVYGSLEICIYATDVYLVRN